MSLNLSCSTPTRRQPQMAFETASLNSSSSPEHPYDLSTNHVPETSPTKYTFTPQRVSILPRAWERRPATPHVPRNESQKIWKRVPLAAVRIGKSEENWRVGNRQPIMRPVKRLRVTHIGQDEDKENIDYVTSKWEEETGANTDSPRRKRVAALPGQSEGEELKLSDNVCENDDHSEASGDNAEAATESQGELDADTHLQPPPHTEVNSTTGVQPTDQPTCETTMDDPTSLAPTLDILYSDSMNVTEHERASFELGHSTSEDIEKTIESNEDASDSIAFNPVTLSDDSCNDHSTPSNPADHDDTAYLHDFLSRARAQKAAKSTQNLDVEPTEDEQVDIDGQDIVGDSTTCLEAENDTSLDPNSNDTMLSPNEDLDPNLSSPRRSSRLITRLPRLQKSMSSVPSSIALKRLNGTEFIAMHKETQSLALTTRTNTKRNKGLALPVQHRLRQLDAEAKARHAEPHADETDGGKRKRKKSKGITWSEQLARYQDGSVMTPPDKITDMGEEEVLEGSTIAVKREHSDTESNEASGTSQEKKQIKKVRKLRKMNIGTVNGTPAPKKTTNLPLPVASTFDFEASRPSTPTTNEVAVKVQKDEEAKPDTKEAKTIKPPSAGILKTVQTKTRTRRGV